MVNNKEKAWELKISRVVGAPREKVWKAWTDPEAMKQWFAPKPFQLVVNSMDFRVGGRYQMAMRGPNGEDFPFSGTYREIAPPSRLVWIGEFTEGPADQMTTVVEFLDAGSGKTEVKAVQTFHVMTETIKHATKGAQQGWTMTLAQLAEFVEWK